MKLIALGVICILSSTSIVSKQTQDESSNREFDNSNFVISGEAMLAKKTVATISEKKDSDKCVDKKCWDKIISSMSSK